MPAEEDIKANKQTSKQTPANLACREHSRSPLTPNLSSSWTLSTAASPINQLFSIPHRISLSSLLPPAWKMWGCASSSHSSIFLLCCRDAQQAGGVSFFLSFFYSTATQNRENEWALFSICPARTPTCPSVLRMRESYKITHFGCCLPDNRSHHGERKFRVALSWQLISGKLSGAGCVELPQSRSRAQHSSRSCSERKPDLQGRLPSTSLMCANCVPKGLN